MNKVLYLDLDGVFADFDSAVRRYTGKNYDPKSSWSSIEKVQHFYANLYPLSGAFRLFDTIVNTSVLPVEILTAVPDPTGLLVQSRFDKLSWVRRFLGVIPVNCVQGWHMKALFATTGSILVDDSFRNIKDWVASGGSGVHHTSNWNTIQELKMMGALK